ncbi:MAG: hypothetical protein HC853_14105 [Anaerolineae bacterium]|nr:hypothetical protein [Anaerolineae bacterium]
MAQRASNIRYFKIEGPGAPARMRQLKALLPDSVRLFGGVGGITFIDELEVGVAGVIPGVGFNEVFKQAWLAWQTGERARVRDILDSAPEFDSSRLWQRTRVLVACAETSGKTRRSRRMQPCAPPHGFAHRRRNRRGLSCSGCA